MPRRSRAIVGLVAVTGAVVLIVGLAGGGESSPRRPSGPFAWLHPASPPAGWKVARSSGGALAYPPGWRPVETDPGTASVALLGRGGRIKGYLNATPKQGAETLANWSRFRPEHNAQRWRRRPKGPPHRLRESLELSLRARLMRDRRLHDLESQLPRDRMPGVRPTIERCGGRRGADRTLGATGRQVGASRLELRALIERDAFTPANGRCLLGLP